jgi:hypothetical protein
MLPGAVNVQTVDEAADYDPSEAVDQNFIVGLTERGSSVTPLRTFSFTQWRKAYGNAVAGSSMYQAARTLFEEGCKALVTIRQVGTTPVKASSTAKNAGAEGVITLTAVSYGEYGNSLTRQFIAGAISGVQLILKEGTIVLAQSGDLTTQAAIKAFAEATGVVTAAILAGAGLPAVDGAPVAFAGGTDDKAHASNATAAAAANLLDVRFGPGLISFPGMTSEEVHALLIEHHLNFDRAPLLDLVDSGTAGTLTGAVATQRSIPGADGAFPVAPWVLTPDGFAVPPSAFAGGKIAQQYLASGNPNEPAAGDKGQADFIVGLTQDFSAATREALDAGGVQAIYNVDGRGKIQLYGFDTLANPETFPLGTSMSNALLDMLIRWKARAEGRTLNFTEIDPQGHLASRYHGLLDAMMKTMQAEGAVYAFAVDTESVNNIETAREKKLKARIKVQRSQYSKEVDLEVTNYAIGANI